MTETKRSKYSEEFKKDAVALVTEQGYTATEAAKSLGLNVNLLYKWRKDLMAKPELSSEEKAELRRLRRENKQLKMEKDILKKASAYFAKEMK